MATLDAVKGFWEGHVNNEYYTDAARGSPEYFAAIVARRYRHHYHLAELFARLRAEGVAGQSLLEIGCGIGIDTRSLADLGFRDVVGVDLTEAAIDLARRRAEAEGRRTLRFEVANGEQLPFADASFDVVYSFGVIHHTPSITQAIAEIRRVLRPGGRALVMIYHRHSLVDLIHRVFRLPYESPRHLRDHCPIVNRYSRGEARALFAAFAPVHIHADYPFTYGMRHLTGWLPTAAKRLLGRAIGWHLMIDARKAG